MSAAAAAVAAAADREPGRRPWLAWLLVGPAVTVLAAVAIYPVLSTLWLSLHRALLVLGGRELTGLSNYASLVHDARFLAAAAHTFYFTAVSTLLELGLGLGFALLLHSAGKGRGLLRAALLVPWAIPTVVSARLWAWLLEPGTGPLGALFARAGIDVLGSPGWALHAAILVDVWKTTPFVALLLLAARTSIPVELYEAAAIDGASGAGAFRHVTWPYLLPMVGVTALFRGVDAFRVFDAVYVLTEGGPGNATETMSIYAYKTLMRAGDLGYGSALSVATFLGALLLAVLVLVVARPLKEEAR